jgi:hypothetical protein
MFLIWEEGGPLGLESCLNDRWSFGKWEWPGSGRRRRTGLRVQIWRPLQAYISFGFVTEENNERKCSALQG